LPDGVNNPEVVVGQHENVVIDGEIAVIDEGRRVAWCSRRGNLFVMLQCSTGEGICLIRKIGGLFLSGTE